MVLDLKKLTEPFRQNALKQRQTAGRTFTYVEGHTVIHRLNEATDHKWSNRVVAFEAFPAGKNSKGTPQTLYTATVEVCIDGLGCHQHVGVQMAAENGGEDLVKGAVTDGLKKAATLFGVGLELYGPDYEAAEISAAAMNARPAAELVRPAPTSERAPSLYPPTREQLNKDLHWEAEQRGLSHEDLHAIVVGQGSRSVADLTVPQLEKFVKWIRGSAPPTIQKAIDAGHEAALNAK